MIRVWGYMFFRFKLKFTMIILSINYGYMLGALFQTNCYELDYELGVVAGVECINSVGVGISCSGELGSPRRN